MTEKSNQCEESDSEDAYCHVKLNSIINLKESTKKLLVILEEIQTKTRTTKNANETALISIRQNKEKQCVQESIINDINIDALRTLETTTKALDIILVEEDDDDCSVYKKLTRKCQCLNQPLYNDFVIHFNEETKYATSKIGEIIKNIRILKKFLYMGGPYTKNALMFLHDGLSQSKRTEKVEIIQGCSNADVCNIFEQHAIVKTCVAWPCRFSHYGDYVTQSLAACILLKLAEIEEGKRYLNLNSKVINEIRKTLRKRSAYLETETVNTLNSVVDLLKPSFTNYLNSTYFGKSVCEGIASRIISDLIKSRKFMTLDEIFMHLDIINNISRQPNTRKAVIQHLPALLVLFKKLLMEYDNSEINIKIMKILNNMVTSNMINEMNVVDSSKMIAETATEPTKKKNESSQIPPKKNCVRRNNKSKLTVGISPKSVTRQLKCKDLRRSIIIVPIDRQN